MRKRFFSLICVLCLCCLSLLYVPVSAADDYIIIDYEDYVTDYTFSDDYKYITCSLPTEYAQWYWFDTSYQTLVSCIGSSVSYAPDPAICYQFLIECQLLGAYSEQSTWKYKALKLSNIPDGTVLSFNIDFSFDEYDNDFIEPEYIKVVTHYQSSDHKTLGRVTTETVSDLSPDLSVPFQLTIDKSLYPDAEYIDFRIYVGVFECYFTEVCTWSLDALTMEFSINAMQDVMDELGYQSELMEDIKSELDEIINGDSGVDVSDTDFSDVADSFNSSMDDANNSISAGSVQFSNFVSSASMGSTLTVLSSGLGAVFEGNELTICGITSNPFELAVVCFGAMAIIALVVNYIFRKRGGK